MSYRDDDYYGYEDDRYYDDNSDGREKKRGLSSNAKWGIALIIELIVITLLVLALVKS